MLESNLVILRNRFPEVLKRILSCPNQEPIISNITATSCIPSEGIKAYLHTEIKKENLLSKWFSNLPLKKEALYALTGFGDGSQIRHFIKHTEGGTYLLVTEKDPCLLKETFSRIDCSDILANDRFLLGTGECDDDFFKDLQEAAMLGLADVNGVIFSPLHSVDEAYYDKSRNEMVRQYLVIRPLMEVNLRTGINLQQNTLKTWLTWQNLLM